MDPNDAADARRRKVLAALGGATGALAGMGAAAAQAPGADARPKFSQMRTVQAEYQRLLRLWQEERKSFDRSSRTGDYWSGPYGRAIIALGGGIIPQLMQEVRKGDFFCNVPLAIITGIDIADGDYRSEQASSKLWLKWWDAGGPAPP